jgi:hypothetical protein
MLGAPSHGHSETEMQPDVEGTRPYVRCMHRCRCHCSGCGRVQLPSVRCRGAFACCGVEVVACGAVACRSLGSDHWAAMRAVNSIGAAGAARIASTESREDGAAGVPEPRR